jgi:hypothetical protein
VSDLEAWVKSRIQDDNQFTDFCKYSGDLFSLIIRLFISKQPTSRTLRVNGLIGLQILYPSPDDGLVFATDYKDQTQQDCAEFVDWFMAAISFVTGHKLPAEMHFIENCRQSCITLANCRTNYIVETELFSRIPFDPETSLPTQQIQHILDHSVEFKDCSCVTHELNHPWAALRTPLATMPFIMVQLKRTCFVTTNTRTGPRAIKNTASVDIPLAFGKYKLQFFICHSGLSPFSGHYTGYYVTDDAIWKLNGHVNERQQLGSSDDPLEKFEKNVTLLLYRLSTDGSNNTSMTGIIEKPEFEGGAVNGNPAEYNHGIASIFANMDGIPSDSTHSRTLDQLRPMDIWSLAPAFLSRCCACNTIVCSGSKLVKGALYFFCFVH